jgi:hypothetical protein
MSPLLLPLHLLLMMAAGWLNRHQLELIEYLQEENRLLNERLGGRRMRFTDAERRRLARRAHALGRKVLNELETVNRGHAGHALAMVAGSGGFQMDLPPPAPAGSAAHHEDYRRSHPSYGA